jgi:hypothetical protein
LDIGNIILNSREREAGVGMKGCRYDLTLCVKTIPSTPESEANTEISGLRGRDWRKSG